MRQKLLEGVKTLADAQQIAAEKHSWANFFTLSHEGVYIFDDEQAYFLHPSTVKAKENAS